MCQIYLPSIPKKQPFLINLAGKQTSIVPKNPKLCQVIQRKEEVTKGKTKLSLPNILKSFLMFNLLD